MEAETVTIATTIIGAAGGLLSWLFFKVVKPTIRFIDKHEDLSESVNEIRKEITHNGGGSLKDVVCKLGETCERIEDSQKVIEQRTKAALHYNSTALFETDESGRVVWSNEEFYNFTGHSLSEMAGWDWLNYIHEEERDDFINEFQSCLNMSRKLDTNLKTSDEKEIRLLGFPYKLNEEEQAGFLVSVSEIKKG